MRTLGRQVRSARLGVLLVGDLSQARGGRATGGHASHQTGLDVDLWYWQPERARATLSPEERETLPAPSALAPGGEALAPALRSRVQKLLALTAEDPRVERVFVHPVITRELCEASRARSEAERAWLRKIRPWYGHDDHFHVRLACLREDAECAPQAKLPPGDGCDKLAFWFDKAAQDERKEARKQYQKTVIEGRGWPERCDALLEPAPRI